MPAVTFESTGAGQPLILVNPRASGMVDPARRDRVVRAVVDAVERRTGRPATIESGSLMAAGKALAAAVDAPLVVAIGGDGTVREAAADLVARGRDTPLAIVPAGTGNVLAGALGIRGARSALCRHGHRCRGARPLWPARRSGRR
jgi:diacylglycerol kinase family enzyme